MTPSSGSGVRDHEHPRRGTEIRRPALKSGVARQRSTGMRWLTRSTFHGPRHGGTRSAAGARDRRCREMRSALVDPEHRSTGRPHHVEVLPGPTRRVAHAAGIKERQGASDRWNLVYAPMSATLSNPSRVSTRSLGALPLVTPAHASVALRIRACSTSASQAMVA